jgi:uracil-DNA glycosylase family 4
VSREDGLVLRDVYISATARCAPPANKPLPGEITNCSDYLDREWSLLKRKRVLFALGRIGWDACVRLAARHGCDGGADIDFAHGAVRKLSDDLVLVGSYHVSQQNTFTCKLTENMFDTVARRCLAEAVSPPASRQRRRPINA